MRRSNSVLRANLCVSTVLVGSGFLLLMMLAIHPLSGKAADDAMVTTASRLQYVDLVIVSGRKAHPGETAMVHYTGKLTNGTTFDISEHRHEPFSFRLGAGQAIKGGEEGIEGMHIGGIRKLIIPPQFKYGSGGAGSVIPPEATLIFEIELLDLRS